MFSMVLHYMTFHIVFRPVKTVEVDLSMPIDISRLGLSTDIVAIVQIVWPFFLNNAYYDEMTHWTRALRHEIGLLE